MLRNEMFKGEVALPFPNTCVKQLLLAFYFCFPFVGTSVLISESCPGTSAILSVLERFNGCGITVDLVASSK